MDKPDFGTGSPKGILRCLWSGWSGISPYPGELSIRDCGSLQTAGTFTESERRRTVMDMRKTVREIGFLEAGTNLEEVLDSKDIQEKVGAVMPLPGKNLINTISQSGVVEIILIFIIT